MFTRLMPLPVHETLEGLLKVVVNEVKGVYQIPDTNLQPKAMLIKAF